jgi:hypothetical protein
MNYLTTNINEKNDISMLKAKIIYIFNEIIKHLDNSYVVNNNFSNNELYLFRNIIKSVIKNLNDICQFNKIMRITV